jgi:hypothetical protein
LAILGVPFLINKIVRLKTILRLKAMNRSEYFHIKIVVTAIYLAQTKIQIFSIEENLAFQINKS